MNSIYVGAISFFFIVSCLLMYIFYLRSEIEHLKMIDELKDMRIENFLLNDNPEHTNGDVPYSIQFDTNE